MGARTASAKMLSKTRRPRPYNLDQSDDNVKILYTILKAESKVVSTHP